MGMEGLSGAMNFSSIFIFSFSLLFLSSCARHVQRVENPGLEAFLKVPIRLPVGSVKIRFSKTKQATHDIRKDMIPNPSFIIESWIRERFKATGGPEVALFEVQEFSLEEHRQRGKPVYKGKLKVRLSILSSKQQEKGFISTSATNVLKPRKFVSLYRKQQLLVDMLEKILNSIDVRFTKLVKVFEKTTHKPSS